MASWGDSADPAPASLRTAVVHEVHVDGLAVLKIVKHCKDALPSLSSGALLGLDQKGVLEITHSFPTPADSGEEQDRDYQMEMMLALREVNVDNNAVGWYQACFHGTFSYQRLIDDLKHYHETIPNSVVLLYDPIQTANGTLSLRAFRLSAGFKEVSARGLNEFIAPGRILDELPVKIVNPGLVSALLFDLMATSKKLSCDFERLDLATNPYLEKNLELLFAWVDELTFQQNDFQKKIKHEKWRRKQREMGGADDGDEAGVSDRMASLLVANQIGQYCTQVNRFAGNSFGKLFLAGALQKEGH